MPARKVQKNKNLISRFFEIRKGITNIPFKEVTRRSTVLIKKRPVISFLGVLLLLFLLILLGNTLFKPKTEEEPKEALVKTVEVYNIGQVPKIQVQAQIKKDGVITIVAQTAGVVQKIHVTEGEEIKKGTTLVSLSSNYVGGNVPSLQRALAGVQLQNVLDTYNTQKQVIADQRQLAEQNANNTEQLRLISVQTLTDTNNLINLNNDILDTLNDNLENLENNNAGGIYDHLILATKEQISSVQAGLLQLNTQSRNLTYSTNTGNPPTQISNLTKDMTLKQLDIQERALELSKQSAQIQASIATVNESLMFPAAPCFAMIQKIHVSSGQSVSPGTPLVTLFAPSGNVSAIARVPEDIASSVSLMEPSSLFFDNLIFTAYPRFVSTQATDGQLYSVIYDVPDNYQEQVANQGFITIEMPIGYSSTNAIIPFIPLDAVFQTQETNYVYVLEEGKAASRTVELGEVLGSDVEVSQGLKDGDQIILDRNVLAGDKVQIN